MVERQTLNLCVVGSSPTVGTILPNRKYNTNMTDTMIKA